MEAGTAGRPLSLVSRVSGFLADVSSFPDESSALRGGIEHCAEAFGAQLVAVLRNGRVVEAIPSHREDNSVVLAEAVLNREPSAELAGIGLCHLAPVDLEDGGSTKLVVARSEGGPFDPDELMLLTNVGRTLALVLRMLRTLEGERAALKSLQERQMLLERLARVQRSISHRAPLQEVLDAITEGVKELMGDEIAGLRLLDPDDPRYLVLVSASGLTPEMHEKLRRLPMDQGAGGRAVKEKKLVIIERYADAPEAIRALSDESLMSAMAVPVLTDGEVVGSLVTATFGADRVYSENEQEMLQALADNASIALTDARTLESMREAKRSKDMFLAMVSHELKTPLTVIMGTLHTVRNRYEQLPADLRDDLLNAAVQRGDDLRRLIDMLLKGARADLSGIREEVFLPVLVAEAVRGFDTTRSTIVSQTPEARFFADATAVHQILGVFLENAVSHSIQGSQIEVTTAVKGSLVSIRVRNQGRLPDDLEIEELFTPFQRGAQARSSGVGLGLYIAKSLADSMEGRIDVISGDGYVEFSVTFPVELRPSGATHAAPAPGGASGAWS